MGGCGGLSLGSEEIFCTPWSEIRDKRGRLVTWGRLSLAGGCFAVKKFYQFLRILPRRRD